MNYEPVIGLEVHVQLKTKSKMFCWSKNEESDQPNVNICEVCTGQPGVLPIINREAVKKTVLVGMALNCGIAKISKFDRKNYFYPDLPKGYQISQFDMPINGRGFLEIVVNGEVRKIGITRAHLEEDAGKLVHLGPESSSGRPASLVDYNRAGVPLLEIVSEPDIRSAEEARIYLQTLKNITRYLGVSDADMEKGHLRVDANVSLRKIGESELPDYKVEIKNMNSFKAVVSALEFEIARQIKELSEGNTLITETRGWVDDKGITVLQRTKEESQDYRYFPEPDLPILEFSDEWLEELKRELPELPSQRAVRFASEYKLPAKDIEVLIADKDLADYFEAVESELEEWFEAEDIELTDEEKNKYIRSLANWIIGPFSALLNEQKLSAGQSKVTAENFAELIKLIGQGKVSNLAAKDVFAKMFVTGEDPSNILDELGLHQVSDTAVILEAVRKVIIENPKGVADASAKGGSAFGGKANPKAMGFLVGQVMKELKGKGNPQVVNDLLKKELKL